MSKNTVVAVACLCVGLILGYSYRSSDKNVVQENSPYDEGVRKLRDLSETEIADYYRLRTLEDRYKKADELLGKMMTIMLADLGLRLSHETIGAMKKPLPESTAPNSAKPSITPEPTLTVAKNTVKVWQPPRWRSPVDQLRSDADVDRFLRASKPDDLDSLLKTSTGVINRATILDLQGTFVGSGNVRDRGESVVWNIEFRFQGVLDGETLRGTHQILLSKNGEVFSNSKGKGNLDEDYRGIPSDPNAVIARAGPDTYLQMYYVKKLDALIGNVFRKPTTTGNYRVIGDFKLNRQG